MTRARIRTVVRTTVAGVVVTGRRMSEHLLFVHLGPVARTCRLAASAGATAASDR